MRFEAEDGMVREEVVGEDQLKIMNQAVAGEES